MSIPAQGRRGVLFSPPGVKIRRTIETQALFARSTMIAGHDPRRVLLLVVVTQDGNPGVQFAGSDVGLATAVVAGLGYPYEFHFVGPEEVWAQIFSSTPTDTANILIQSVFYD